MFLIFLVTAPRGYREPTVGAVTRHSSPRSLWTSSAHLLSSLLKSTVAVLTRRSRRSTRTCQLKTSFRKGDCVYSEDQLRLHSSSRGGSGSNEHNHIDSSVDPVTVAMLPRLLTRLSLLALQTNKADRYISSQHEHHLAVELRHPTRVFLCLDKRLTPEQMPPWIAAAGFVDSALCVYTSLARKAEAGLRH